MKGGPKITYKTRLSKNIKHLNIMKSYEENKLLGGASCVNHIFFKCVCPGALTQWMPTFETSSPTEVLNRKASRSVERRNETSAL